MRPSPTTSDNLPARFPFSDDQLPPLVYEPAAWAVPPPPRRFQNAWRKHILLFLATLACTTLAGAAFFHAFLSDFSRQPAPTDLWYLGLNGLWYSGTLLLILGAHELGHYAFCRYYDVDASLPYFIPMPIVFTGTMGAVIRIREPFPNKTALFDVGVAGPIAGFVVLVPALFAGLLMSHTTTMPTGGNLMYLGEPLLFQWAASAVFGALPPDQTINMHPMVFAAWFGMFATALNLLPFGQLDGGHVTYATLDRWSTPLSLATVGAAIVMTFVSPSWLVMTIMMVLMLLLLGPRHPRVIDEDAPLASGRRLIALAALGMLIICFTPIPIEIGDIL